VNVIDLHIMREHPNYWDLQRTVTFRRILQSGSFKGLWFFVKLVKQLIWSLKCVVFFLLCVIKLKDDVMGTGLHNLFGLKGLCYKVYFGT